MGDLCGPKTRVGEVAGSPLTINPGDRVCLGLPDAAPQAPTEQPFIPLDFPELLQGLETGMPVFLSDGMLRLRVTRRILENRLYELEAGNSGVLTSHKGIAFPGKYHPLPAMTPKDRKDLSEGIQIGLDAVALSFVQTSADMEDIRGEIRRHGVWIPVVAKLERRNAVDNLDSILALADAVMVARGDLGLECPMPEVPVIQKRILRAARHAQKGAIVATQMLLSMVSNPAPTRAEATDVANAILDGADCVMLSEETAMGKYPVEAVRFISEVAQSAEAYYQERIDGPYAPRKETDPVKFLAYGAALLADTMRSRALVCHTVSGSTARLLSSRRPAQPVYALTPDERVLRALNFFWGVQPRRADATQANHLVRAETFVQGSAEFAAGENAVIISGQPTPGQPEPRTNTIKVYCK